MTLLGVCATDEASKHMDGASDASGGGSVEGESIPGGSMSSLGGGATGDVSDPFASLPPGGSVDNLPLPLDKAATDLWNGSELLLHAYERWNVEPKRLPRALQQSEADVLRQMEEARRASLVMIEAAGEGVVGDAGGVESAGGIAGGVGGGSSGAVGSGGGAGGAMSSGRSGLRMQAGMSVGGSGDSGSTGSEPVLERGLGRELPPIDEGDGHDGDEDEGSHGKGGHSDAASGAPVQGVEDDRASSSGQAD